MDKLELFGCWKCVSVVDEDHLDIDTNLCFKCRGYLDVPYTISEEDSGLYTVFNNKGQKISGNIYYGEALILENLSIIIADKSKEV